MIVKETIINQTWMIAILNYRNAFSNKQNQSQEKI